MEPILNFNILGMQIPQYSIFDLIWKKNNLIYYTNKLILDKNGFELGLTGLFFWEKIHPESLKIPYHQRDEIVNFLDIDSFDYRRRLLSSFEKELSSLGKAQIMDSHKALSNYIQEIKHEYQAIIEDDLFCYYLFTHIYLLHKTHGAESVDPIFRMNAYYKHPFIGICDRLFANKLSSMRITRLLTVIHILRLPQYNLKSILSSEFLKFSDLQNKYNSFIKKAHKDIDRSFNYLIEFCKKHKCPIEKLFLYQLNVKTDKRLTFTVLLFVHLNNNNLLELFVKNYQKANLQQRQRDIEKTKATHVSISKTAKQELMELAKANKIPQAKLLDKIIHDYYEQVTR